MTSIAAAMLLLVTQVTPRDPYDPWAEEPPRAFEPAPPSPEETAEPPPPSRHWEPNKRGVVLAMSIATVAAGLGACSWFARDLDGGWACTTIAGSLGFGLFIPGLIVAGAIAHAKRGGPGSIFEAVLTVLFFGTTSSLLGLIVGGVVAGVAGAPPGVQRGAVGLSASGLFLATYFPLALTF